MLAVGGVYALTSFWLNVTWNIAGLIMHDCTLQESLASETILWQRAFFVSRSSIFENLNQVLVPFDKF